MWCGPILRSTLPWTDICVYYLPERHPLLGKVYTEADRCFTSTTPYAVIFSYIMMGSGDHGNQYITEKGSKAGCVLKPDVPKVYTLYASLVIASTLIVHTQYTHSTHTVHTQHTHTAPQDWPFVMYSKTSINIWICIMPFSQEAFRLSNKVYNNQMKLLC